MFDKTAWSFLGRPLAKMGGWMVDYADDHENGIKLAKEEGVQFIE